jgi:hypothetical protein
MLPPSSTRVIVKRIILTGHPYKIYKKLVTIRYMFFNREDVEWFKALQLWTKRGRSGLLACPHPVSFLGPLSSHHFALINIPAVIPVLEAYCFSDGDSPVIAHPIRGIYL